MLNKQKRLSLQQASVLFFGGIALTVLLALLTYSPNDHGFFHQDNSAYIVKNWVGGQGAYVADFLFGVFGFVAFLVPVVLLVLGFTVFRLGPHMKNPNNPRGGINSVIVVFGAILALLCATALAQLLFASDFYPQGAGGLLGKLVSSLSTMTFLGYHGSIVMLLSGFLIGITLVGDISWGAVTEKIGDFAVYFYQWILKQDINTSKVKNAAGSSSQTLKSGLDKAKGVGGGIGGLFSKMGHGLIKDKQAEKAKQAGEFDPQSLKQDDDADLQVPNFENLEKETHTQQAKDQENAGASGSTPVTIKSAPMTNKTTEKQADKSFNRSLNKAVTLPDSSLLNAATEQKGQFSPEDLNRLKDDLVETLSHYGVSAEVTEFYPGPVITRFELQLAAGTKVSKVSNLAKDLARNLGVSSVRVVEVITGKTTIGIEVPNEKRALVAIRDVIESNVFQHSRSPITLVLGKDIAGNPEVADLAKMPHLLVAGTTGSGKSVAVNAMLVSMLYKSTPEEVRLLLIDPKMLELSMYEDIPHLLTPVITDMKDAANGLRWCVAEMERRYQLMSKVRVRNLAGFNDKIRQAEQNGKPIVDPLFDPKLSVEASPELLKPLPFIVVVIDEFADMMMVVGKKVEELIARIAQKARAAGIHLILATQRTSVDVITGLIKANIPSRIAFQVSTKIDSRTVIDQGGAEQLLGYGDMLYLPPGTAIPNRVHGAFVGDNEVQQVVDFIRSQGEPDYIKGVVEDTDSDAIPGLEPLENSDSESDPLYDEAISVVTESRRASISYLQRRLKVGYNRAARMIEDMEKAGVVSAVQSNGSREVLAPPPIEE
jgi:S-DNA-T family DNA segregation ATPase FtsK/SpoIIIE